MLFLLRNLKIRLTRLSKFFLQLSYLILYSLSPDMILKKISWFAVSIIKLFITLFIQTEIAHSVETYNKYFANEEGINSRIDEIQASILNFKLSKVDQWILRRRQIAKIYFKYLNSTSLTLPKLNDYSYHVYHLYTVYHPNRDKILKNLKKKFVETRIIYQYPIHKMTAYKNLFSANNYLKNSEKKSKGIFCLPLYPEMTDAEVLKVCKILKNTMKELRL